VWHKPVGLEPMTIDRRSFMRIAALTACAVSTSACYPDFRIAKQDRGGLKDIRSLTDYDRRVLDRICYGVSTLEAKRVAEIGLHGWIEEQLSPDEIPEVDLHWRMRNLEVLDKDADAIEGAYKRGEVIEQLRRGTLLRQIYSRRQIYEMMVEFWSDHFNISVEKGPGWVLKIVDDRDVIRRHSFGSFHDLLSASAHSPAMLVYLDNQANDKHAPNENYARELLELHTLGIDGGYNQGDIGDLARCLTGWTVKEHFWRGRFDFDEDRHDYGSKELLGMRIEPAGKEEVERILAYLARDTATGRHLSIKILRRFMCDDPEHETPEWVGRLEQVFTLTRGNINAMLRKLLFDGILKDPSMLGKKVKRPVDFIVSALRITSADSDGGVALQRFLDRMGQPTFAWPTPDGPPDQAANWSTNFAPRWAFSLRLMAGLIEGSKPSVLTSGWQGSSASAQEVLQTASAYLLGDALPEHVSLGLIKAMGEVSTLNQGERTRAVLAGLLASPAFQYR
jgi:uncharacterized protein (DUF1800 family)